jgi:hypothetical protein
MRCSSVSELQGFFDPTTASTRFYIHLHQQLCFASVRMLPLYNTSAWVTHSPCSMALYSRGALTTPRGTALVWVWHGWISQRASHHVSIHGNVWCMHSSARLTAYLNKHISGVKLHLIHLATIQFEPLDKQSLFVPSCCHQKCSGRRAPCPSKKPRFEHFSYATAPTKTLYQLQ